MTPKPITIGPFGCSIYSKYPPIDIHSKKIIKSSLTSLFIGSKVMILEGSVNIIKKLVDNEQFSSTNELY